MLMKGSVLSQEEKKLIHEKSIEILEEIGIKVPLESVLTMLEQKGASVDWDKKIACISRGMIEEALKTIPKEFTLGARNPEYDLVLPSSYTTVNLDGCGVNMLDFHSGKRRSARLEDVAAAARVFEEIPLGSVNWTPVEACDVPVGAGGLIGSATSFMNCSKHLQDEIRHIEEKPYLIEMLKAITGGEKELRQRKIYSVTYCTVAPLAHDADMLEATMSITEYEVPILIYPMPACGSTGPASLYSNIAMANAEILSCIVIFQLANPKVPLVYGAALGAINMRSGLFLEGAAETVIQLTAMGEMGNYYGLPTIIAGCLTDAKAPGMQSIFEKTITSLPLVLAGVDVVQGIGLLESSMTLSLEHIIIDGMIAETNKRLWEGVCVDQQHDFFEDIKAVGPEGHFLKRPNTRKSFRSKEFYIPELIDRGSYEEWLSLDFPDLISKARAQVTQILAAEKKHPLDASTEKVIKEIMEEAAAKLG